MRKKPTEKQIRKSDIGYSAMVGQMVYNIVMGDGVCGIHPYLEKRPGAGLLFKPGVMLQPRKFMELFGEDTEYEYLEDHDGDRSVITEVNGVMFYALINDMDRICEGRLV